jgi:GLPGLI family protein
MSKKIMFLFLITFNLSFSQEVYKIDYEFTDNIGNKCNSTLYTDNKKEAVYKIYDERQRGTVKLSEDENNIAFVENDVLSKFFYATPTQSCARFTVLGEEIVYGDDYIDKMNWKINPANKKIIGKYNCTEAKINLNGRSYTVWFTFDVPMKFGPLKLHNLPGLIVEAKEDNDYLRVVLKSVAKTNDINEFNKYKNYFLKHKDILDYASYGKVIINLEFTRLMRGYNMLRKDKIPTNSLTFEDGAVTEDFMEFPINFVSEVRKAH